MMKKTVKLLIGLFISVSAFSQTGNGNGNGGQPGTTPGSAYDQIYVNNFLKVGTNSLWLNTTQANGSENRIFSTNGPLTINGVHNANGGVPYSPGNNTLINPSAGLIGIGLTNPNAKLDINLGDNYLSNESGLRITYPVVDLPGGPIQNQSLFEIRRQIVSSTYLTQFVVKGNGNVGIGVSNNDPLLDTRKVVITDGNPNSIDLNVRGFALLDGNSASLLLGGTDGAPAGQWGIEYNQTGTQGGLNFWKPFGSNNFGNYYMFIADNGRVGIATNEPQAQLHVQKGNVFIGDVDLSDCENCGEYKLFVRGGIRTEKIKVDLAPGVWADYVFDENYELKPLDEVEEYIQENCHLPNMPGAIELEKEGLDLGAMYAKLLEKIEELTLYMIELKKQNKLLQEQINIIKQ